MSDFTLSKPKITIKNLLQSLKINDLLIQANNEFDKNENQILIIHQSQEIDLFTKCENIQYAYIARQGNKFDGHSLAEKVLNSGNIFVGQSDAIEKLFPQNWQNIIQHKLFISIKNIQLALPKIFESSFSILPSDFEIVAVTGTNGKTSVTQITGNLLEQLTKKPVMKIGTLGVQAGHVTLPVSHVTTPDYPSFLNILATAKEHDIKQIVLEYTSHGLTEGRLGQWKMDVGIFTNLTQDHLDYHHTMENYRAAKQKLFQSYLSDNGTAIINLFSPEWENFASQAISPNRELIAIGNKDYHNYILNLYANKFRKITFVTFNSLESDLKGIRGTVVVSVPKENSVNESEFNCPLIGEFQIENLLCAIGAALSFGYNITQITKHLPSITAIPGRLEKVLSTSQSNNEPTVLVDYAHTPDALDKAIETCKKALRNKGQLYTVFGCGGDRDKTKRPQMGNIAFKNSHFVIVTSDNPRTENPEKIIDDIFEDQSVTSNFMREADRKKAIEVAIKMATKNDIVLIAGKGHEDYQIIGTTKIPFSDVNVVKLILDSYDQ